MIIFSKPPIYEKFDVKNPNLEELVKKACPPFDMAYPGSIADNFGYFYFGIGDGFRYSPKGRSKEKGRSACQPHDRCGKGKPASV